MPEEIHKGVDCRKTSRTPPKRIRIAPRGRLIEPGDLIALSAGGAPFDCDPGCYRWGMTRGKGTLSPKFGKTTYYRAPEFAKNVNCEWTVVIFLIIARQFLDFTTFTINTFDDGKVAYDIITLDQTFTEPPPHAFPPYPGAGPPPKGATSWHVRMQMWARQYTCRAKLINKYAWSTRDFYWTWQPAIKKWRLSYLGRGPHFESIYEIAPYYKELDKGRAGDVIDKRSREAKEGGCCPLALVKKEFEPPLEPLPYY